MDMNGERTMYPATCSDCGQATEVPFQPSGDRPVFCRDCFSKKRQNGGGYDRGPREMHDAVCADCGNNTQVPFRPRGDKPVYCRDCFAKHRN